MYEAAICLSATEEAEKIRKLISKGLKNKKYIHDIEIISSLDDLREVMEAKKLSLIIIDEWVNGYAGIKFVEIMRLAGDNTDVIMISDSDKNWIWGYRLGMLAFLTRPVEKERLISALDRNLRNVFADDISLRVKDYKGRYYNVKASDIIYMDIIDKDITIHLTEDKRILCKGTLTDIENKLYGPFIRCHNSYIVNAFFIDSYKRYEIKLTTGAVLRISKKNYKEVIYEICDCILNK